MTRSIAAAIAAGAERLRAAGFDTPRLDAEVLLRHVLGIDRTQLFTRLRDNLESANLTSCEALIERRLAGTPVAYLTGCREFMGMPFQVGPGVLVPRPETELLVERALEWLQDRPASTVLDIGTGSGAIAISVVKRCPSARVIATDLSPAALKWAQTNRVALGASVDFALADLAEPIAGPIDLLLANLPYLRPEQLAGNPDLQAEPAMALIGGNDGLDLVRRLIGDAPRLMWAGGAIALEIDPGQAAVVESLAREWFPDAIIATRADLAGFARHVWIQLT